AGHGEMKFTDANLVPGHPDRSQGPIPTIEVQIDEQLSSLKFKTIELKSAYDAKRDYAGFVLLQASKSYSDADLRAIDDLVMAGKPLVVIAGAANLAQGDISMTPTLDTHHLDKLLAGYGIEMRNDIVLDWGAGMEVTLQTPSGPMARVLPQFI